MPVPAQHSHHRSRVTSWMQGLLGSAQNPSLSPPSLSTCKTVGDNAHNINNTHNHGRKTTTKTARTTTQTSYSTIILSLVTSFTPKTQNNLITSITSTSVSTVTSLHATRCTKHANVFVTSSAAIPTGVDLDKDRPAYRNSCDNDNRMRMKTKARKILHLLLHHLYLIHNVQILLLLHCP